MSQLNSLLVALDFKETSSAVCKEAIVIAKTLKTEVTLVHAVEYLPYYPYYPYDSEKVHDDLYHELSAKLDILKNEFVKEGLVVNEHIIKEGKAYSVICTAADEINACGIIIGCGDHYLLENLIGSTADKVVRMAKQAVILLNHNYLANFNRILCAYDFSKSADNALNSAIYMAKLFKAHLDIVHIVHEHAYFSPVAPVIDPSTTIYKDHREEMEKASETVRSKMQEALDKLNINGISYDTHIREGQPVIELSKMIKELKSDLLVIAPNSQNAFVRFFLGSTTEKMIRKAPCSIMTVKENLK
ncbi:MAG: universal stress protein [Lentisphaeraceae bacterium]|nr:universal stress protein [Lentisphaeraceae bacterium]